jgi:uncharacterized membrane protein YbaN (DUF454 family)
MPFRSPPSSRVTVPGERDSPLVRGVLFAAGSLCFVLAVLGIFLPLLPATPLFIAAAACFARAYRPLHQWMLDHRWLGPMLRDWYRHRSLPYRTKLVAIATMLVSFGVSIAFFVRPAWLKAGLAVCALALAAWLYRIPSRDGPRRPSDPTPPPLD